MDKIQKDTVNELLENAIERSEIVSGPALFHIVGIEVELGIESMTKLLADHISVSKHEYAFYQLSEPRGPIHLGIEVTPEDKIIFRTGGGRKLPVGRYIVSTFGREYYAMKTLES